MSAANAALAMPYPGLRPFEAEDQPLFFGREAQVSGMLRQLEDHRFVAVVGSSGSGKSSLVRAGLLPAVREGFLLGTTDWVTIVIKPGHQPYQRLVRALHQATRVEGDALALPAEDAPLTPEETATLATLRRTDRGLLTALGELAISPESRVILVVDQFEELFAFRRTGMNRDTVASRDEAAAFVGMLLRSASEPAGRVWAILTMRSDFIGDCEAFLGLPEQISHSQFLVPRLDRGQMEEAIVRPAAVEEGAYKTFTFEDGLVNRIINEAGDRPDQLPLMQHALMRTWKRAVARAGDNGPVRVTPDDYEAAGGIEKALSLHADAAWDEIKGDPKKAHLARRLFLLLCDISPDGQITRRRPRVDEVQAVTGASVAEIEEVIRVYQQDDRNFLLPPPPQRLTAESYLDISHEALLRQWRLFAGEWQEQERRDASELRRLAELASLRKQNQEVGLLSARDLDRINRWKQRVSPEWARRYVTQNEWVDTLTFVEDSQAEVKREEEVRRNEARRKRVWVLAVSAGLAILAVVAAVLWSWNAAEKGSRKDAERQKEKAIEYFVRYAAEKITRQLSEQAPNIARAQLFCLGVKSVFQNQKDFPADLYAAAISMFGEPYLFEPEAILDSKKPIRQIAYSADGRLGVLYEDGDFCILDVNAARDLKALESTPPLQNRVAAFSFHPRGKPVVALRRRGEDTAILLNYEDNRQPKQIALPLGTSAPPNGATGYVNFPQTPTVRAWEPAMPLSVHEQSSNKQDKLMGIAFSPAGDLLAVAVSDNTVRIFSVVDLTSGDSEKGVELAEVARTRSRPRSPSGTEDDPFSEAVLPDAPATGVAFTQIGPVSQLVTSNTGGVWVWPSERHPSEFKGDLTHERLVRPVSVKGTATSPISVGTGALGLAMCIAPYDDPNSAVLFRDKTASPNPSAGEEIISLRLLTETPTSTACTSAACAPDGQLVAVGVGSGGVGSGGVYIFRSDEMLQRLDHNGKVNSIAFRPDARVIATVSGDSSMDPQTHRYIDHSIVRLWGLNTNGQLAMQRQPVFAKIVALSPDGRWLASLEDDRIRLRDAATGKIEREAKAGDDPKALAVNDDGHVFALTITSNKNEVVHEAVRRDIFSDAKAGPWRARNVFALSPNAKWAVCTSDTGVLEMVDADTGDSKPIVPRETAAAASKRAVSAENVFAISHSGRLIAAYDTSLKRILLYANPCLPAVRGTSATPGGDAEPFTVYTEPSDPHTPAMDLKRTIPYEARLTHLAFAPNERLLFATTQENVATAQENDLLLFDLKLARQLFRRDARGRVASLSTGGAPSKLVCAIEKQPVHIWGDWPLPDDRTYLEKISGVTFNAEEFNLIKRPESEPLAQACAPMDTTAAAFWDTLWDTRMRVAKLTSQSSSDDLEEAYAHMREVFARGEPPLSWQADAMRQRLAVMPPWPPADAGALRARFDAMDQLEPLERVILLRDGILPFAKDDATIRAAGRFRLAVERMANKGEGLDPVKECVEVLAAGYTDVDEILRHWPIRGDVRYIEIDLRYAEIFEKELLPRVSEERKADRAKVFIALAEAHGAAGQGVPSEAQKSAANAELDLAFKALEEAIGLGFQDWGAEWSRIEKLTDDPRFKLEWLPRDEIWVDNLVRRAVPILSQDRQTGADRAARLLRAALERDPKNYMANFQYGRALRVAARAGSASWNDAAKALDCASAVAGSRAERVNVQVEKGNLWNDAGEWEKALDAFDAALREDPNNRSVQNQRKTIDNHRTTLAAQIELTKRGFYHGSADGMLRPMTSEAISRFQREAGLPVSGTLDNQTLNQLGLLPEQGNATPTPPSQAPGAPSQK